MDSAAVRRPDVERVLLPGSLLDSLSLPDVPGGMWGGVLIGVFTVTVMTKLAHLRSAHRQGKLVI